jgi:hypothetical protein
MAANGRWFFEGMPLGNQPPITVFPQEQRSHKGFYPPSRTANTAPLIGTYGWAKRLTITGQTVAADGDFLTMLQQQEVVDAYLRTNTRAIEDIWLRQHDVLKRSLGTIGYVVDIGVNAPVASVTVQTGDGIPFGTTRFTVADPADLVTLGVDINDRIVVTIDPDVALPSVGEIGIVTAVTSTYVEIVSRVTDPQGESPYETESDLVLMVAEGFYGQMVYRESSWAQPRTHAEGAAPAGGVKFVFEGYGNFIRRADVIGASAAPPNSLALWGDPGNKYGANRYGA